MLAAGSAYAAPVLPQGGQFVAGAGVISASGAAVQINQSTGRGIIDWRSFNVGAGGSVVINNGSGATLNRVTGGGSASQILGQISATGSVYLVNPQGVVVGPSGKVIGGGSVVLSSRDIDNGAFMAGGAMTASGTSAGAVSNAGKVIAQQGDVIMIGQSVSNTGSVIAANGEVDLAAANTVLLAPATGSGIYVAADTSASGDVTEEGRIKAAAASLTAAGGNVYTLAGNHKDLIEATGSKTVAGKVWLSAPEGSVSVAGTVKAQNADGSGGEIVVQGARSTIISGTLDASGLNGGNILVGVTAPQTNLSDSTTLADGAVIKAGGPNGGGQVETSGHTLSIGQAQVTTAGGSWLLDPTNLTIGDTGSATTIQNALASGNVTLTTNNGVTETGVTGVGTQASGAGDIDISTAITWSSSHSLILNAQNNLNITAAINGGTAGGLVGTAGGAVSVAAAINAGSVSLTANGGNVTLASGGTITSHAAGGITLNTTANFVNNAGSAALSATGGNWRIYSTNPNSDTLGGLAPDFYQYAANIGATALGTGNGALYSVAPTVTYALVKGGGTQYVTKVYDGTNNAAGVFSDSQNISASGQLSGDTVVHTGTVTYAQSWDVGADLLVAIGGIGATRGGKPVYGYTYSGSLQGVIGQITPAAITIVSNSGPTKVYDGGATETDLTGISFTVTPGGATPIAGQTITIGQPTSVVFDSAAAGTTGYTVKFANSSFVAGSGVNLNDYNLQPGASWHFTNGMINQYALAVKGLSAVSRDYNGSATVSLNGGSATLYGALAGDTVSILSSSIQTGTLANGGAAGNGITVSTAISLTGAQAADYKVTQPTITVNITPVTVTLTGLNTSSFSKTYDGTTTITGAQLAGFGTAAISAVSSGESSVVQTDLTSGALSLNTSTASAAFASKDAASSVAILLSGYALNGTGSGNYTLSLPSLTGVIAQAQLTASWTGGTLTKQYNGSSSASEPLGDYTIAGWADGNGVQEGATLVQLANAGWFTDGTGAAPLINVGSGALIAKFALTDFSANTHTNLQNYKLPANLVVAGSVTPAPLTITIVGDPTKPFDGTTTATLGQGNFQIVGWVSGEGGHITQTMGAYAASGAGAQQVSAVINSGVISVNSGTLISNYSFTSPVVGLGTITQAAGTGAVIGVTGFKLYDGTNTDSYATNSAHYTFTFTDNGSAVGNVAVASTGVSNITYGGTDAGQYSLTVQFGANPFTGTNASTFAGVTSATGVGTINPRQITLQLASQTKVYNGTNTANLTGSAITFTGDGFVSGQGVTVNQVVGVFGTTEATPSTTVSATVQLSDLSFTGGAKLQNYTFTNLGALSGTGSITQAPVVIQNVSANNKTYDTTNAATLTSGGTIFGVISADLGSVALVYPTASVTFAGQDAGTYAINGVNGAGGFTLTGAKAGDYSLQALSLTATINPKTVNLTGLSVGNMVYNNTTVAPAGTLTGVAAINGSAATATDGLYYSGDAVSLLVGTPTATFAQANVGTGIAVTVTGYSLTGAKKNDYTLVIPGFSAAITARPLSVSLTEVDKVYDGTTTGYLSAADFSVTNWAQGEGPNATSVAQAYSAAYNAKDVTTANLLTATLVGPDYKTTLPDLSNYSLPASVSVAAHITPATLTAAIVGDPTKVYNNNTIATLGTANVVLMGFVNTTEGGTYSSLGSTTATYYTNLVSGVATKDVGVISIRTDGTTLSSATFNPNASTLAADYNMPTVAVGAGAITPLAIGIINAQAQNKVYNGATAATITGATLSGVLGTDVVTLVAGTGQFDTKDVVYTAGSPSSKPVTASGYSLSGANASDYSISQPTGLTAIITPAALTVLTTKVYDGTTTLPTASTAYSLQTGASTGAANNGKVYSGDTVTLTVGTVGGAYTTKDVDTADVSGHSITGITLTATGQGGDYAITSYTGTITPAPLTVTNASVTPRAYDGLTDAVLNNSIATLSGFFGTDSSKITLNASAAVGTYATKDVGSGIVVHTSGYGEKTQGAGTQTDLDNYTVTSPTLAGNITQATISLTITKVTKVYDGTSSLPSTSVQYTLGTLLNGADQVSVDLTHVTGAYDTSSTPDSAQIHVGSNLWVSIAGLALMGTNAIDYTIASTFHGNVGFITPKPIDLASITKTYDTTNTLSAGNVFLLNSSEIVGGDSVSVVTTGLGAGSHFSQSNAGTGLGVTVSGLTLSNGDYSLNTPGNIGVINPATLNVTKITKVYDNTTAVKTATTVYTLGGVLGSDTVSINQTGVNGTYNSGQTDVVSGWSVSLTGLALTGAQSGNYVLGSTSLTNDAIGYITPRPLTVASVVKTYDTTNSATTSGTNVVYTLTGLASGDTEGSIIDLIAGNVTGTYTAGPTAGTGLNVSLGGLSLQGSKLSDYSIAATQTGIIGTINKKALTLTLVEKTYDNTNSATSASGAVYTLSGFAGSDTQGTLINLVTGSVTGTYTGSYDVGSGLAVSLAGLSLTGTNLADYSIPTTFIGAIGKIDIRTLTIASLTKVYDNDNLATAADGVTYALGNVAAGDSGNIALVTGGVTGTYTGSFDVGSGLGVSLAGLSLSGKTNDYQIAATQTGTIGAITKRPLTIVLVEKTYDNTNSATSASGAAYTLSGFASGDSQGSIINLVTGSVTGSYTATFDVASGLAVSLASLSLNGTKLGDYSIATTFTGAVGKIDPRLLSITAVTKTYDNSNSAMTSGTNVVYTLGNVATGDSANIVLNTGAITGTYTGGSDVGTGLAVSLANVALTGAKTNDYTIVSTQAGNIGVIVKRALTVASVTKTYDTGNSAATSGTNVVYLLSGFASGDSQGSIVNLAAGSVTGTYTAGANVGNNLAVSLGALSLNGSKTNDYSIATTQSGTIGFINPAAVTLTKVSKVYDNLTAVNTGTTVYTLTGILGSDTVSINPTGVSGTFDAGQVNVTSAYPITLSGLALQGAQSGNYLLTATSYTSNPIGYITPRPLTVASVVKTYDTTNSATTSGTNVAYTLTGFASGDSEGAIADLISGNVTGIYTAGPTAGTGLNVSLGGLSLNGTKAGDYSINATQTGTIGTIIPKALTLTLVEKTYDNTNSATAASGAVYTLSGFAGSDTQGTLVNLAAGSVTGTYTGSFDVGSSLPVSLAGLSLTGTNAVDYSIPSTFIGSIGKIDIRTLTITSVTKVYDSTNSATAASGAIYGLGNVASGDSGNIALVTGGVTGTYDVSDDVGTGLHVNLGGLSLSGAKTNDYQIAATQLGAIGVITARPLTIALVEKTYDNTNAATSAAGAVYTLGNIASNDSQGSVINLVSGSVTGTYTATYDVASGLAVTLNNLSLMGSKVGDYSIPATFSGPVGKIDPRLLSVTSVVKTYDTGNSAAQSGTNVVYTLGNIAAGDSEGAIVDLVGGNVTGTYTAGPDVGTGLNVSLANLGLQGSKAGDYTINATQMNLIGVINPKTLTVTSVVKTYDSTNSAAQTGTDVAYTLGGILNSDAVTLVGGNVSGTYTAGPDVGTGLNVALANLGLTGAKSNDYSIVATQTGLIGVINPRPLTITLVEKTYDNTASATSASGAVYTLGNVASGDSQGSIINLASGSVTGSYTATYDVASGLAVTLNNLSLTGSKLGDYSIPTSFIGNVGKIDPRLLSVTSVVKTYDTGNSAAQSGTNVVYTLGNIASGDSEGAIVDLVGGNVTGTYTAGPDVGTGLNVSLANLGLNGLKAGDYTINATQMGLIGVINPKTLTITSVVKTYDSTNSAAQTGTDVAYTVGGILNSDAVSLVGANVTGIYTAGPDVGTGLNVSLANLGLTGAKSNDYSISATQTGLIGVINPRPLTITLVEKTYDNTNAATQGAGAVYTLGNVASGDSQGSIINLVSGSVTGTYTATYDVASGLAVTLNNLSLTGSKVNDYAITGTFTGAVGKIDPRALTVASVVKTYDNTNSAAKAGTDVVYTLGNIASGDSQGAVVDLVGGNVSGTYTAGSDVGTGLNVALANLGLNGSKAGDYTITTTQTGLIGVINPRPLTVTSVVKTYDTTNSAAQSGTNVVYTLGNIAAGDSEGAIVDLVGGNVTGVYTAGPDVGTGLNVSLANLGLAGSKAGDYTINATQMGLIGTINPKTLTVTSVVKTYDTTNSAAQSGADVAYTLGGILNSDAVTLVGGNVTGTYTAGPDVGTGLNVSLGGLGLTGAKSNDYTIVATQTGLIGIINPKTLTVTSVVKTYDSTNSAAQTGTDVAYTIGGVLNSDAVSLVGANVTGIYTAGPDVGTGLNVSLANLGLTGAKSNDYTISTTQTGLIGVINPKTLTVTSVVKTYDTTNSAAQAGTNVAYTIGGILNSDAVSLVGGNVTGTYTAGPDVGTGLNVALANLGLTGAKSNDYTIATTETGLIGVINPKTLTVTSVVKTYDNTNSAAQSGTDVAYTLGGILNSDAVTLVGGNVTGTYTAGPSAGAGLNVSLGGLGLTGAKSNDYAIVSTQTGNIGTINARPLSITLVEKTYDNSNAATQGAGAVYTLGNLASGDSQGGVVDLVAGSVTGTFTGSYDVGSNLPVSLAALALTGSKSGDYSITGTFNANVGKIDPRALAVTSVVKTYDATNSAAASSGANVVYTLGNIASGDSQGAVVDLATGAVTGTYTAGPDVGTGLNVALANLGLAGSKAGDYTIDAAQTGLIGTINPKALAVISVVKTYDGANSAAQADTNVAYALGGIINSDDVSLVGGNVTGTYTAGADVGTGLNVSLGGLGLQGAKSNDYTINAAQTGLIGTINPKALTLSLSAQTKVYDANANANGLTSAMFTVSGLAGSEQAELVGVTSGLYNTKDVDTAVSVTVSGIAGTAYVDPGTTGFNTHNYILPTTVTGLGSITPYTLSVTGLGVNNKVYDGTSAATLSNVASSSLMGVFAGDDVMLSALPGGGTFVDSHNNPTSNVGANIKVILSGQAISGRDADDYVLSSTALPNANITPAPLTAVIIGNPTKTYDGTTTATLGAGNFQLSGFVAGQGASVTQTSGTYADPNAGSSLVTALLSAGQFSPNTVTSLSNYTLPTSASGLGLINPAQLTVSIVGDPSKYFDGNDTAKLTSGNYQIGGFIGGDGATIGATGGVYGGLGPGDETVTAQLAAGDWSALGSTRLGNYVLPGSASGPGRINPALSTDLYTRFEAQLVSLGQSVPPSAVNTIREIQFTMATPRIYIPFPAPGALSTWKGNGFGSLPIVVDQTTDYNNVVNENGVSTQSGAAVLNDTVQILMQGVRSKQYRVVLPDQNDGALAQ